MYEVKTDSTAPVNVFAGEYPVATEVVATDGTIRKLAPVVLAEGKAKEADAEGKDKVYGIAAADSTDGAVVVYLTGEFFAEALTWPEGVKSADVKEPFRKIGIFLKGTEKADP